MNSRGFGQAVQAFLADQDGVTSIEYALLAALIFGLIVVSVGVAGGNVEALYQYLATRVADAAGAMP